MNVFDKFEDYMFSLLFTPLRKGLKAVNQFLLFFRVIGRLFDDCKEDIFTVRQESMVISASEIMLPEHGRDRKMPRLKDEDAETYRYRLSAKAVVAQQAGLRDGVILALKALGYETSTIEPFYLIDPERWAEFIVYLSGKNQSSVNDIQIIDAEVMKVKEASSKPFYAMNETSTIKAENSLQSGIFSYQFCGTVVCGMWP